MLFEAIAHLRYYVNRTKNSIYSIVSLKSKMTKNIRNFWIILLIIITNFKFNYYNTCMHKYRSYIVEYKEIIKLCKFEYYLISHYIHINWITIKIYINPKINSNKTMNAIIYPIMPSITKIEGFIVCYNNTKQLISVSLKEL